MVQNVFKRNRNCRTGPDPTKILQRKFNANFLSILIDRKI